MDAIGAWLGFGEGSSSTTRSIRPVATPPFPAGVPSEWRGVAEGDMRHARLACPCVGRWCVERGGKVAVGQLCQPFRDVNVDGCKQWQRMCEACVQTSILEQETALAGEAADVNALQASTAVAPADSEISPVIVLIGLIRRVGHLHYVGAADMLFALAPRHRGSSSVAGRLPLSLQPPSPLPTAQPPQSPPQSPPRPHRSPRRHSHRRSPRPAIAPAALTATTIATAHATVISAAALAAAALIAAAIASIAAAAAASLTASVATAVAATAIHCHRRRRRRPLLRRPLRRRRHCRRRVRRHHCCRRRRRTRRCPCRHLHRHRPRRRHHHRRPRRYHHRRHPRHRPHHRPHATAIAAAALAAAHATVISAAALAAASLIAAARNQCGLRERSMAGPWRMGAGQLGTH